MKDGIIKFDGTISDWVFVIIVCAVYLLGKYVNRPKAQSVLTRQEVLSILVGLSIYRNMEPAPDKQKEIEDLRVKVSKEM